MKNSFIALITLVILGCQPEKKSTPFAETKPSATTLRYASGFRVTYQDDNTKLVEVVYPFQGATSGYKYLLVPKGQPVPEHQTDVRIISIPLSSIICTSTTHIPLLDYLGETEKARRISQYGLYKF